MCGGIPGIVVQLKILMTAYYPSQPINLCVFIGIIYHNKFLI